MNSQSKIDPSGNHQSSSTVDEHSGPRLIFPGGGLFFYWQAGVISHLQEEGYNLSNAHLSGASAGALSATLAATGVDFYEATELALSLSEEAGVWDRPLGLQGIWGDMIHTWLDELLPHDADEMVSEKLHILVTPVPSFGKQKINKFDTRDDLIHANMASVHLPWFLNGDLTKEFRGQSVIDGSFLAKPSDYLDNEKHVDNALILDFKRDPVMQDRSSDFVNPGKGKQFIWDILEQGKRHAQIMDNQGEFRILQ
eukprot:CAMPEP_0113400006 /NCGR_PEP_ID=MMETSP0013_2-20120614/15875_1 /TAXON_ID=2843 ORGANISM="Skeletonema costatum, Strain 1716" /NCGR_SAMPLE_ID=MMETSP0013_2 /ASSEMBLY_ACC=CAM_ASM_000158 /LENGTH=253 /DNA_ID=CAMNT_0000285011 /DNA_START=120 /DNA_END=881 /DNA_ORIENTATION=+ /assembly_acc=CAM_ASM_000158